MKRTQVALAAALVFGVSAVAFANPTTNNSADTSAANTQNATATSTQPKPRNSRASESRWPSR